MKKLISLLLCIVLILSLSVVVYASENSKLSTRLEQVLGDYEPDEQIGVYLSFNEKNITVADMPSWPDIAQARKEHKAYREQKIAEYFAVIFETIEYEEIYVSSTVVIVSVKVQDIQKLAEYDIIQDIGYFENTVFEPYDKDSSYLFEEQYREYVSLDSGYVYDEMYYHFDAQGELDWAIIYALVDLVPSGRIQTVSGRVISVNNIGYPYPLHLALYDVRNNEFISIEDVDATKYEGVEHALAIAQIGDLLGDTDLDNELSILDATEIQRVLAKIIKWSDSKLEFVADFDQDGDVSIMDATAIQRRLAKLDVPVATPDEV